MGTPEAVGREKRIAYFLPPSKNFAGIERVVHELASGLASRQAAGMEVHVIFANAYDEVFLSNPPYVSHVLHASRLRSLGLALRRCVRDNKIDMLICPQIEPSVVAFLATRLIGLSTFVTHLHGNPEVEKSRNLRSFVMHRIFGDLISSRVSAILAVSPSLAKYASKTYGRRKTPVHYLPNPVRVVVPPLKPKDYYPDSFVFVCVARLVEQKGQDILLRAFKEAIRKGLQNSRLVLVGDGPDRYRLEKLVDALGVKDIVDFVGYVSDPTDHLVAADCFVLASRWEGFGVAIIEALHVGLPVIVTDCDFGPRDIVTRECIGSLVPIGNTSAFAEALLRVRGMNQSAEDTEERRELASSFNLERVMRGHIDVLSDLQIGSRNARESNDVWSRG